jgi:hypothetical protein
LIPIIEALKTLTTFDEVVDWIRALPPPTRKYRSHTVHVMQRTEYHDTRGLVQQYQVGGWLHLKDEDVFLFGYGDSIKAAIQLAVTSPSFKIIRHPRRLRRTGT